MKAAEWKSAQGLRGNYRDMDADWTVPQVWETSNAVRLGDGQSYVGRLDLRNDEVVWVEWLHDGAWGDDPTHRLIVKFARR